METKTINASDETQYGSAANGATYRGRTIGSGYDCEVSRESETTALACLTHVASQTERLTRLDVEPGDSMQTIAISWAACPEVDSEWASMDESEAWDALAEAWDRLRGV